MVECSRFMFMLVWAKRSLIYHVIPITHCFSQPGIDQLCRAVVLPVTWKTRFRQRGHKENTLFAVTQCYMISLVSRKISHRRVTVHSVVGYDERRDKTTVRNKFIRREMQIILKDRISVINYFYLSRQRTRVGILRAKFNIAWNGNEIAENTWI